MESQNALAGPTPPPRQVMEAKSNRGPADLTIRIADAGARRRCGRARPTPDRRRNCLPPGPPCVHPAGSRLRSPGGRVKRRRWGTTAAVAKRREFNTAEVKVQSGGGSMPRWFQVQRGGAARPGATRRGGTRRKQLVVPRRHARAPACGAKDGPQAGPLAPSEGPFGSSGRGGRAQRAEARPNVGRRGFAALT